MAQIIWYDANDWLLKLWRLHTDLLPQFFMIGSGMTNESYWQENLTGNLQSRGRKAKANLVFFSHLPSSNERETSHWNWNKSKLIELGKQHAVIYVSDGENALIGNQILRDYWHGTTVTGNMLNIWMGQISMMLCFHRSLMNGFAADGYFTKK